MGSNVGGGLNNSVNQGNSSINKGPQNIAPNSYQNYIAPKNSTTTTTTGMTGVGVAPKTYSSYTGGNGIVNNNLGSSY